MSNFINKIMDDIFDKLIFFFFFSLMLCALFGGIHCFASLFVNFPIIIQIEQQKDYNSQPIFSISAQKQLLSSHNSYSTFKINPVCFNQYLSECDNKNYFNLLENTAIDDIQLFFTFSMILMSLYYNPQ